MTVRRMALAGNMPYAQLIEENVFTPFIHPKNQNKVPSSYSSDTVVDLNIKIICSFYC